MDSYHDNTEQLTTYTTKIGGRYDASGIGMANYDEYPLKFKAAAVKDGYRSSPECSCSKHHDLHSGILLDTFRYQSQSIE